MFGAALVLVNVPTAFSHEALCNEAGYEAADLMTEMKLLGR